MKKLEKLNSSLFESLESSKMSSLNTVMGGTYDQWTSDKKAGTCDTETRTGQKCDDGDKTNKECDVQDTDCKVDHDYLVNNPDLLFAVAIDGNTPLAS